MQYSKRELQCRTGGEDSVKARPKITIVYAKDLPDSTFGADSCCDSSDNESSVCESKIDISRSPAEEIQLQVLPVISVTMNEDDSVNTDIDDSSSYLHPSGEEPPADSEASMDNDISSAPPIEGGHIEHATLLTISPRVKPSPRATLITSNYSSPRVKPSPRLNSEETNGLESFSHREEEDAKSSRLPPPSNHLELNEEVMQINGELSSARSRHLNGGGPDNFAPSVDSAFSLATNFQPIGHQEESSLTSGRSLVDPPSLNIGAPHETKFEEEPLVEYRAPPAGHSHLFNLTNQRTSDGQFSATEDWEKNLSSLRRASPLKESEKSEFSYSSELSEPSKSLPRYPSDNNSYHYRSVGSYPSEMTESPDRTSYAANIPSLHTESATDSSSDIHHKNEAVSVAESKSRNPTLDVVPADRSSSSSSRPGRSLTVNKAPGTSQRSASVDRGTVTFSKRPLLRSDGKPPVSGSARDAGGDARSPSPHKFTHYNSPDDVLKKFNTKWQKDRAQNDWGDGIGLTASMKGTSLDNIPLLTSQVEDFNQNVKESTLTSQTENSKLKDKLRQNENAFQEKVALLENSLDSYKERLEKTKQENVELRQRAETDQLKIQRLEDRLKNLESAMSSLQSENRQLRDLVNDKNSLPPSENEFSKANGFSTKLDTMAGKFNSDAHRSDYQNGDSHHTEYQRPPRYYSMENKLPRPASLINSENNKFASNHSDHTAQEQHSSNSGWISPTALERRVEDSTNKYYASTPPKPGFSETFEPPKIHPVLAKIAIKRKRQQRGDGGGSGMVESRDYHHKEEAAGKTHFEENRRPAGIKPPVSFNKFRAEAFTAGSSNAPQGHESREFYGPPPPAGYHRDSGYPPGRISESDQSIGVYIMGRKVGTTSPESRDHHHRPPLEQRTEHSHYPPPDNLGSPKKQSYPWRRGGGGGGGGYRSSEEFEDKWQNPPVTQYNSNATKPNQKFIEETKKKIVPEEWTAERDAELKRRVQKLLNREANNHSAYNTDSSNQRDQRDHNRSSYNTDSSNQRREPEFRHSSNMKDRYSTGDRHSNGPDSSNYRSATQLVNSDDYEVTRTHSNASHTDDSRYYTSSSFKPSDESDNKRGLTYNTGSLPRNYNNYRPSSASHSYSKNDSSSHHTRPATSESSVGMEGLENKPYSRNSYSGGVPATSPSNPVPPLNLGGLQSHKIPAEGITELTKSARRYADELVQKYMGQRETSDRPIESVK